MRVIIVDPSLFTIPYDCHLCGGISNRGHEVFLYGRSLRGGEQLWSSGFEFQPFFFRLSERKAGQGLIKTWSKAIEYSIDSVRFVRQVARLRPDIIHFQWLPIPALDRRTLSSLKKRGAHLILTVHDTTPFNDAPTSRGQVFGWREVLEDFHALIVHTAASKKTLEEYGVKVPIYVVPHGLLTFGTPQKSRRTDTLLFLGAIKPYKGLEVLLRAFDDMKMPATLRIVGKAQEPATWYAQIRDMKRRDHVLFEPRWFDDAEIPELMAESALVVFPYHRIDGSGALLTAIAYDKPFIATRVGMFAELAGEDSIALVTPGDVGALSRKLDQALTRMQPFQDAACRIKSALPSWVEIGAQTEQVYRQAIRARRGIVEDSRTSGDVAR